MPISGLILNVSPGGTTPRETLDALRHHPSITMGEQQEHRIPIVVESADSEAAARLWEWLQSLPGIMLVDLVYLHLEENEAASDMEVQ